MILRQVALAARDLAPVRRQLFDTLGIEADYADPGVGAFGLENSVMTIGDTFLEVVAPVEPETAAGRWLDRHGGDGGYMAIFQVDDIVPHRARIEQLGVRRVWETDRDEVQAFHLHPRDIGAAIVSIDRMVPADEWLWAGPGFRDRAAKRVSRICGIDVEAVDPAALGARWAEVLGQSFDAGASRIPLEHGAINFVPATTDFGDVIAAIEFETPEAGLVGTESTVGGTRLRFVGSNRS